MTDDERLANVVTALADSFRQKTTPAMYHGYRLGLAGVPIEQVERAAALALQRCKFMPVPAELRELATGQGEGYAAMAEKAWHVLRETIRRLGPDYSVNFEDGAINATVRLLGGWIRICEIPAGDELEKWFRKSFLETYCRVCQSGTSEEMRRYHGGHLERDNVKWLGRNLPGSKQPFRLGMFGTEVQSIGVDYKPALPAPEPRRQLEHARPEGVPVLELKRP